MDDNNYDLVSGSQNDPTSTPLEELAIARGELSILQAENKKLQVENEKLQERINCLKLQEYINGYGSPDQNWFNQLKSLAATYVTARRNGHPDAPKHLDALLEDLGVI